MLTRRRFLVLIGSAAPVAAGIGLGAWLLPGEESSSDLPTVRWNETSCDHCGMIISDRRFAASWITANNKQTHFDDVGCMVSMTRDHAPADDTRLFVRDYANDGWLNARTATYVTAEELRSPMAYGVAAFADRGSAEAAAGDKGHIWNWAELVRDLERMGGDGSH